MVRAAFRYHNPCTVAETVTLLAKYGGEAKLLAGGQSLVPILNLGLLRTAALIDLGRVTELNGIERQNGHLRIGAMVRHCTVAADPAIAAHCPLLAAAAACIGHSHVRLQGTVGGSLAHADPAAEYPTAAVALDAQVHVAGPGGSRVIPTAELFLGPLTTSLAGDELITAVTVPVLPPGTGWAFVEFGQRHGDFALVGVAALMQLDSEGRVASSRVAVGGASPVPLRSRRAEAVLAGRPAGEDIWREAAAAAADELDPDDDLHASAAYRRQLARIYVRDALRLAAERTVQS